MLDRTVQPAAVAENASTGTSCWVLQCVEAGQKETKTLIIIAPGLALCNSVLGGGGGAGTVAETGRMMS